MNDRVSVAHENWLLNIEGGIVTEWLDSRYCTLSIDL